MIPSKSLSTFSNHLLHTCPEAHSKIFRIFMKIFFPGMEMRVTTIFLPIVAFFFFFFFLAICSGVIWCHLFWDFYFFLMQFLFKLNQHIHKLENSIKYTYHLCSSIYMLLQNNYYVHYLFNSEESGHQVTKLYMYLSFSLRELLPLNCMTNCNWWLERPVHGFLNYLWVNKNALKTFIII